jgi:hypothetical protein
MHPNKTNPTSPSSPSSPTPPTDPAIIKMTISLIYILPQNTKKEYLQESVHSERPASDYKNNISKIRLLYITMGMVELVYLWHLGLLCKLSLYYRDKLIRISNKRTRRLM